MNHSELPKHRDKQGDTCGLDVGAGPQCPLSAQSIGIDLLTADLCDGLENAGCPIAPTLQGRLHFETLLTELSAKFVNVPANKVDSQIESGLQLIVELLGLDQACLAEVSADGEQFVVTHSNQLPGVPTASRLLLDSQLPTYARMIRQGKVVRASDELPSEATPEREYCLRTGLKSHLAIPLTMMGSVVGLAGFCSFRSEHVFSDELTSRLRLVADIFANALVRKCSDEMLRKSEERLQERLRFEKLLADLSATFVK